MPAARPGGPDPVAVIVRQVLPHLLLLSMFGVLVRLATFPLSNFDTYFHLRFGHEFLDGWSLRHPGSVTTFGTADWVPTQWLPQIVMARTEDWFGLAGVAWLSGLQFLTLALVFFLVARRWADPLVAAPVIVVAIAASGSGLSMRPQILSYLLVAVTVAAWQRAHESGRTPWLLIPMTWVWSMCHGMWPVGIVIGVVAVTGIALDRRAGRAVLLRHLSVPVLSGATSLLTPVGPGLFSAVLLVNSRGKYFYEWAAPDFTKLNCVALLALFCVTLVVLLRNGTTNWFTVAMMGLTLGWSLYSLRTVPVAAAMLVPVSALALQSLLGPRSAPARTERLVAFGGYAAALVVLALVVPRTSDQPPPQPAWVDPALSALPVGTKVLDESSFGGYLMWRYPQLDLVASGYGDLYTDAELERNYDVATLNPGWDDLAKDTGARIAVLDPESLLGYALTEQEGWRVVHDDPDIVMLEAPSGWADEE